MEKAQHVEEATTFTPQALAVKLGISAKKLRALLRTEFPREGDKSKRWEIPVDVAKKVERKLKVAGATKQAKVDRELKGG